MGSRSSAQGVGRIATRRGSSVCPDQVAITKARRRALLIPLLPQRESRTSQSRGSFASHRSHGRPRSEHHPIGHREAATPSHARSLDGGRQFADAPVYVSETWPRPWANPQNFLVRPFPCESPFASAGGPRASNSFTVRRVTGEPLPSGRKLGVCRSYSSVEHFCGERGTFGPPNVLGAFKNTWKPALNTFEGKAGTYILGLALRG